MEPNELTKIHSAYRKQRLPLNDHIWILLFDLVARHYKQSLVDFRSSDLN